MKEKFSCRARSSVWADLRVVYRELRKTGLACLLVLCAAQAVAAVRDGALRVEVITAYNLVVDSNAGTPSSYAPRS